MRSREKSVQSWMRPGRLSCTARRRMIEAVTGTGTENAIRGGTGVVRDGTEADPRRDETGGEVAAGAGRGEEAVAENDVMTDRRGRRIRLVSVFQPFLG